MNIAFLTNKTASVSLPVYRRLAESLEVTLVHTFFYDNVSAVRKAPHDLLAKYDLRTTLSKGMAIAWGMVKVHVVARFGKRWVTASSPLELAIMNGLPHSTIDDINCPNNVETLRQLKVDALVVCVCKNILRKELLSSPGIRFINIHPSLLPKYRGPTPTFWMLYNGEKETGVSIHLMTPKIDHGTILAQRSVPLDRRKTESQIELEVFSLAADMIQPVLRSLSSKGPFGSIPASQGECTPTTETSYFSFPTPKDRRELKRRLAHQ